MKSYRTSMKIDYDEHRPLEVEAIFGRQSIENCQGEWCRFTTDSLFVSAVEIFR